MKHILLILFTALSFSAIGQTVPMTNNVPWYEYSKKLSVGKFMLKSSGEYDTSFTIPSNTASITLDTISADKTVTFTDGASTDRGVTMWIQNSNNSAFIWNVAGNVKEADGTVISNLPRGLHIFYWNSNAWIRLSTSGGSSPTVDTLTFSSPLVQLDKNVSLDFDAFPQDTVGVVEHNDSLFNILYSHTGVRDSTFIVLLTAGGTGLWGGEMVSSTFLYSSFAATAPYSVTYYYKGASAATFTMPALSGIAVATAFLLKNESASTWTIEPDGSDDMYDNGLIADFDLAPGEWAWVISDEGSSWHVYLMGGGGGGNTNSNIGSGYRLAVPGTNNIKTIFGGYGVLFDSTSNTNALTAKVDTLSVATKAYSRKYTDSLFNTGTNIVIAQQGITGDSVIMASGDTLYGRKLRDSTGIALSYAGDGAIVIRNTSTTPSITSTTVGYGDGSNALTSEAAFNYTASTNTLYADTIKALSFRIGGWPGTGNFQNPFIGARAATSNTTDFLMNLMGGSTVQFYVRADGNIGVKDVVFQANQMSLGSASFTTTTSMGGTLTGYVNRFSNGSAFSATSGNLNYHQYESGLIATSGTATYNAVAYQNVFTQTGGATGTTRCIYINPSLTNVADFRAIDVVTGKSIFKGLATNIVSKTTTYTATESDHSILADATSGAFTVTLPAPSAQLAGMEFFIKKTDSGGNAVTVSVSGGANIDGSSSYSLSTQWKYVKVQATSSQYYIIGNN